MHDLLVLGSGVAGLTTALAAARQGLSVLVVTKAELAHTATRYAQGGVAAALTAADSPDLHLADTLIAGAGLCDPDAVGVLVAEGPARVRELARLGARFDARPSLAGPVEDEADPAGAWLLAREGGHSVARVVHAGGDATGAEIERALVAAVLRSDAIDVRERTFFVDLLVERGRAVGVLAVGPDGVPANLRATNTVLATGGAGQCFAVTTNPTLSTGDGLAAALRAGVACADVEFVQFHPTALHVDAMPRPLISEALRGEGAVLRDERGAPIMAGVHPMGDLAPRDVVARRIAELLRERDVQHVFLDATTIDEFAQRFPTIAAACARNGLEPQREWLPVAPAAHYFCGGVLTDLDGATTMPHLWACGEVAASGVHGANRLASNSLLDGLVFGARVVRSIADGKHAPEPTGALRGVLPHEQVAAAAEAAVAGMAGVAGVAGATPVDPAALRASVQRIMTHDVGVVRDAVGLELADQTLDDLATLEDGLPPRRPDSFEARNLLAVARAVTVSALLREESRGSHTRADFPEQSGGHLGRYVLERGGTRFVPLAGAAAPRRAGRPARARGARR